MKLDKIKNGEQILKVIRTRPMFFQDIVKATSLDAKKLQSTLNKLQRNGFAEKTNRGLWQLPAKEEN